MFDDGELNLFVSYFYFFTKQVDDYKQYEHDEFTFLSGFDSFKYFLPIVAFFRLK